MTGSLVLVATPIGNLGDVSQRSREALAAADLIACEDSRHSGRLVKHLGIADPTYVVVNEHTERDACARIVDAITAGKTVALITDAGTPAISDPGAVVVRAVLDAGLDVSAVPGPAALVMALVISGLPTTRFVFEGFIPRSGGDRDHRLADIALEERTTIIYESPHRIVRTLADLANACGSDRRVAVARELTKLHEEVWRGTLAGAIEHFSAKEPQGEFVVVIDGAGPAAPANDEQIAGAVDAALANGLSVRDAADHVATALGVARRTAYRVALSRRGTSEQP
ncbi:MAG: 16S rRNA (cytidine(1402)-2'-O)-methyltransferase [Actinobacteria bacterium]|nr:16S rRNA (cytidine(1402)-2'-O)-methyltransferase [Actinomycetota bacterium]